MKTQGRNSHRVLSTIVGLLIINSWLGCSAPSASDSSSSGSSLNITGLIDVSNSSQSMSIDALTEDAVSAQNVVISDYTVTCATATTPVLYGTGAVGSDGSFSVNIIGGAGQPMSCYLVDAAGDRAADFLISDSSSKDLNGQNQVSGTATFNADANMGSITYDPNSGEVTVPSTNIAGVLDTAAVTGTLFDPTGSWTIGAVDFTLPSGVKGPVASSCNQGGGSECNGPPSGQAIYMKLWKGIKTADSKDIYGLQLWNSESQATSCGNKIGLTSTIKTSLGVDFSANGAADDVFTFATSVANFHDNITNLTGTVNLTEYWKMDTATSQYNINPNCGPHDVTIGGIIYSNAWVCGPDLNSYYQVQIGGGCVNSSTNVPVQVTNWSGINTCTSSEDANGIKTNTCSGTTSVNSVSTAVTCTNKWAVTNASYAVLPGANFNWNDLNAAQIPSGTLCSSASFTGSVAKEIAQNQCYANYYWQSGFERESNTCLPKIDMDWSATTAADFVKVDKIRPNGLVFFEQFKPFSDASGGTMVTRQEHYAGVQVDGNSWVNCRVIDMGGLTIKKISDSKMIATYQSSQVTTSLTKPACLAKFTGARETFVFYLTK